MATKNYSNRELDQFFKAADDRADSFHSKLMARMDAFEDRTGSTLNRIEEQTRKTNGRVTTLEDEMTGVRLWRARILGALSVLAFISTGLLTLLGILASAGKL